VTTRRSFLKGLAAAALAPAALAALAEGDGEGTEPCPLCRIEVKPEDSPQLIRRGETWWVVIDGERVRLCRYPWCTGKEPKFD
jgi:hypothetical protein